MKPKGLSASPLFEGLAYGVCSLLAIDQTSSNYLLIVSWASFLGYLLLRFYSENQQGKRPELGSVARFCRLLGWALILPLAAIGCIGGAQR